MSCLNVVYSFLLPMTWKGYVGEVKGEEPPRWLNFWWWDLVRILKPGNLRYGTYVTRDRGMFGL